MSFAILRPVSEFPARLRNQAPRVYRLTWWLLAIVASLYLLSPLGMLAWEAQDPWTPARNIFKNKFGVTKVACIGADFEAQFNAEKDGQWHLRTKQLHYLSYESLDHVGTVTTIAAFKNGDQFDYYIFEHPLWKILLKFAIALALLVLLLSSWLRPKSSL